MIYILIKPIAFIFIALFFGGTNLIDRGRSIFIMTTFDTFRLLSKSKWEPEDPNTGANKTNLGKKLFLVYFLRF